MCPVLTVLMGYYHVSDDEIYHFSYVANLFAHVSSVDRVTVCVCVCCKLMIHVAL